MLRTHECLGHNLNTVYSSLRQRCIVQNDAGLSNFKYTELSKTRIQW